MTLSFGRALRTGLSSLRDRAANLCRRLAASRFNPSRMWEEVLLITAFIALIAYIVQGHRWPDPLPIALAAILALVSRMKDRMP